MRFDNVPRGTVTSEISKRSNVENETIDTIIEAINGSVVNHLRPDFEYCKKELVYTMEEEHDVR